MRQQESVLPQDCGANEKIGRADFRLGDFDSNVRFGTSSDRGLDFNLHNTDDSRGGAKRSLFFVVSGRPIGASTL